MKLNVTTYFYSLWVNRVAISNVLNITFTVTVLRRNKDDVISGLDAHSNSTQLNCNAMALWYFCQPNFIWFD